MSLISRSIAFSSYFCTKSFKSSYDQVDSVKMTEQPNKTDNIEVGSSELKPEIEKNYNFKAKPMALREMNIGAPTSM